MGKLIEAINNGNAQAVRTLLSGNYRNSRMLNENIKLDSETWTPLLLAIKKKNLQIVIALIDAGADVNYFTTRKILGGRVVDVTSPLCFAAARGRIEVMQELLRAGANLNQEVHDTTPLNVAVVV